MLDFDQDHDVLQGQMALKRWSTPLRHIVASRYLDIAIKLRLYPASVCSLLSYGCESWRFTDRIMRRLNGVNAHLTISVT